MEDVRQYTAPCDTHCLDIFLYDCLCFTLPQWILDQFVFIDSRGTEHALDFAGSFSCAHVTNVSLGMGKLVFRGEKEDLAEACGFDVHEDGKEKQVPKEICQEKKLDRDEKTAGPLLVRKKVTFHDLSRGVDILVANKPACTRAYIRFQVGASDWLVHMAWMDNHSGGFHGSGHYGVMIVNGKTNEGMYADFGMYHMILKDGTPHEGDGSNQDYYAMLDDLEKGFDMVRVTKPITVDFTPEGLFADDTIAEQWSKWNSRYGSEVVHRKQCKRIGIRGPDHQWTWEQQDQYGRRVREAKPPYNVDGILGWAGFRLKRGAYDRMRDFIMKCEATADAKWEQTKDAYARHSPWEAPKNQYSVLSFNCMTFGLCVYEAGANPNNTLKGDLNDRADSSHFVNHPNSHISEWVVRSHDGGYFYDRQFQGKPAATATTEDKQKQVTDIRREPPPLVTGSEI